ncbi:MAG: NUDIX domain-containing protein [Rickettsiales bacterium]|jgi:glycerol-3-phosphate dehydrogenase (NAD(P)+)|nr:NUDIX domain-containing protein [Rickettsiales bacterium]
MNFKNVGVIGAGRWGGWLAYYVAKYKQIPATIYGRASSKDFEELQKTHKNEYLVMPDNVFYTTDLTELLKNDFIIISVPAQNLRDLCKELNGYDLKGKTFLLAMKGLEKTTSKRLTQVFNEEVKQKDIGLAVLVGPGHVQDYVKEIPSCMVIDSDNDDTKKEAVDFMNSQLIRIYYGTDLIGTEIGAALKNVVGIAAGILDGLNWSGLKGALMARAPVEVGRFISHFGGNEKSAYGLAHLGDYEATLFSPHSRNRAWGESFAKGKKFDKLAEGVDTLKAVYSLKDKIDLPISRVLYETINSGKDPKQQINSLFNRPQREEFIKDNANCKMKKPYVRVIIKNEKSEYLLMLSKENGLWNFTGGKIEDDEDAIFAGIREAKEELNLTPSNLRLLYLGEVAFPKKLRQAHYYMADADLSVIKNMEPNKCEKFGFFSIDEMKKLPLSPSVKFILENDLLK